jgi:ParB family chromosome partitioning protein
VREFYQEAKMPQLTTKPLSWLKVNPQVRKTFSEEDLQRLGESLKVKQQVPVLTQPDGVLIDGERRLRAAQRVGMTTLDVIIADKVLSDFEAKTWQLTNALHRADLTGYEKWVACTDLLAMNVGYQLKDLAELLRYDPAQISRLTAASKCIGEVQDAYRDEKITTSDVYAISKQAPSVQIGLLNLKLSGAITSRDALERVGRQNKKADGPVVRTPKVRIVMPGATVLISGKDVDMDELIELLAATLKEARKAAGQRFDVKTWQSMMSDKAKAEVADGKRIA